MSEAIELLQVYVKGLERKLDAERALADDLADMLGIIAEASWLRPAYVEPIEAVLARYRQARGR